MLVGATLATVTANYLGEAASSDSAFFTEGASKQTKFSDGVAVFIRPRGGLMADASLSGQGFSFVRPDGTKPSEEKAATRPAATRPAIWRELFVSPRTVDAHLSHIYRKLDINTRARLAALVVDSR